MFGSFISTRWGMWTMGVVLVVVAVIFRGLYEFTGGPEKATASSPSSSEGAANTRVEVVTPRHGGLLRLSTQPGNVQSFESVDLFSKVPGFLEWQGPPGEEFDIGTMVKKDQVLARIFVPEYVKQVQRNKEDIKRAESVIDQMKAAVVSAEAEAKAADSLIPQAEAVYGAAKARLEYREKQLKRITDLVDKENALQVSLKDEEQDKYDAAVEHKLSAKEGIIVSKSRAAAMHAKVLQANADLEDAKAKKDVAIAELERSQVFVDYSFIKATFNGVISKRNFFPGDFIRSADSAHLPLLTIDRLDKLRVIVQVPDRDVPFTKPGRKAEMYFDALPGKKFTATVSRVADSEDPASRTMRTEVDIINKDNDLRPGMYGQATIILSEGTPNALSLPASAIYSSDSDKSEALLYVVRNGKAQSVTVKTGQADGISFEVVSGLKLDDQVIINPNNLHDGDPVTATPFKENK